jgi:cystathionine gamma-synthase
MSAEEKSSPWSPRTLVAQAMGRVDAVTRAIVAPIHVATTYIRDPDNAYRSGFSYGRPDNQTVREAEEIIAMLEKAPGAMVFSSGMSAATSVFLSLSPGEHVIAPKIMYWGLRSWLLIDAAHWGLETSFVDPSDLDAVRSAIKPGRTKLIWIETPSNPLWEITDINAVATIAHAAGARLAVDSTCASPVLTRPLQHGADIVMHAATKYLNGHSDVIAGALAAAEPDALWERIAKFRKSVGTILGPFEAFLLIRGMRTLDLRVRASSMSALSLAIQFKTHPLVANVLYPGLQDHPGHAIAARQMEGGFGGMLSIRLKGGERVAIATAANVSLWKRATSLGGVESLIEHRASVEGASSPCPTDLLRLSTGIEDPHDLYADLDEALNKAAGPHRRSRRILAQPGRPA